MTPTVLFGLPYAGGSAAAIYGKWATRLPRTIELRPLELAGHGRRMAEPFDADFDAVVADLLPAVRTVARHQPYALFGHSMGATLAYELVRAIERGGLPSPRAVFLSGRHPPHVQAARDDLHLLADDVFLAEISRLGGTPKEFFAVPELVRMFLPILRSDYRLIERYRCRPPLHVIDAPLVLLHGSRDPLAGLPGVAEWQRCTRRGVARHEFAGDHFFINQHTDAICQLVADALEAM